jgi:hypothetical protein
VSIPDPAELISTITHALECSAVPYMLTGSFAGSLHGSPRTTHDLDIVIAPDESCLNRLLDAFPTERYYVSREAALQGYRVNGMFNVIDLQSGWKVDFIFRKSREFSLIEFERRREYEFLGTRAFVATAEDLLIAKLEWSKLGESERQLRDAAGILRTQGQRLDSAYIESWVKQLDLENQWTAVGSMRS